MKWSQTLVVVNFTDVLKSPQPVRCILIIDRPGWVDLCAFVFKHPRDQVNDLDTAKREKSHTSSPALGPHLPLLTQLWVSQRPVPEISVFSGNAGARSAKTPTK